MDRAQILYWMLAILELNCSFTDSMIEPGKCLKGLKCQLCNFVIGCDWYSTKEPATQLIYKLPSSWINYCIISNFGIPHIEQVPHGRRKEQLRWSRLQRLPLSMRSTTSRGPDTARDFLTMVVAVSDPQHLQLHLPGLISRHAPAVAGAESVGYGWCETSEPHRQNQRQSQGPKWSNQGLVGLEWVMGSHNFPNNGSQPMK